ncbi:MAG TPA: peptidoglycan DD-metalloendopeptidase family protein [Mycobacteriales bacterium]|nr:peptidoglycan DD-metalloendopeptidase family protein [Mycobacteriales bacterium]
MTRLLAGCAGTFLALTGLAPASRSVPAAPVSTYEWPLRPAPDRIVRDFDPPAQPWLAGNRGLDLAGHRDQAVHAANSGIVTFAGPVGGTQAISISFGALRTTYEPVRPSVRRGQVVHTGEVIGRLDGPVLHWGLLRGADYLDPLALLGLERVRLLPINPLIKPLPAAAVARPPAS